MVPHANGAGDNKRKGGEDGSEPSAKKSKWVKNRMGSSCFCCLALKSPVHLFLFRVDCDEIVICDEVAASSADDLKKAKKVNVEHF